MNPEIKPIVITIRETGVSLLVCGRRVMRAATHSSIYFPVAIQLTPKIDILHDLRIGEGAKEVHLDTAKIPLRRAVDWPWPFLLRTAEAALADAHRTVSDPIRTGWRGDKVTFTAKPEMLTDYKGGTISRNIFAWLAWDAWNHKHLTIEQRAEIIRSHGFKCTAKALQRAAAERGL
jgi:hypothetical protein